MTIKVVCGACNVEPEVVSDDHGKAQAVCPSCGRRDDAEDAMQIAGEHFIQQAMPDLQRGLAGTIGGKKHIKFTPEKIPEQTFRWHAG